MGSASFLWRGMGNRARATDCENSARSPAACEALLRRSSIYACVSSPPEVSPRWNRCNRDRQPGSRSPRRVICRVIYFDTSYLVRLYYQDLGASQVRALAATDHVACALLGQAEMMAAFHRKLREGAIKPAAYAALVGQVETHIEAGAFHWIAQDQDILARVRQVYRNLPASVYLRGADAIHLGTAAEAGFRFVYSNDAHLLAAARHFGIEGRNVI
jgi:predicted nucleic acid-binding protein